MLIATKHTSIKNTNQIAHKIYSVCIGLKVKSRESNDMAIVLTVCVCGGECGLPDEGKRLSSLFVSQQQQQLRLCATVDFMQLT